MKIFILRNVSINRLLDSELEQLRDAGIEFAITDNNGPYGIDNTECISANMNTLVFMWEEYYVEEEQDWIDRINKCGEVVGNVIKGIFEFYAELNPGYMKEWEHIVNGVLTHMNSGQTVKYDISLGQFIG